MRLRVTGWAKSVIGPSAVDATSCAMARWRTCGSAKAWSIDRSGRTGMPAALKRVDERRGSSSLPVISSMRAFSRSRFLRRARGVAKIGMLDQILAADREAEAAPHRRRRRDIDMAVARSWNVPVGAPVGWCCRPAPALRPSSDSARPGSRA